ncbi:MAG: methylated-DNA--[protein]-cysteine S-methyltransferase [Candidatus Izemoplasmatales bacterium]|jgi:methylated-DNA-[protein]-cysteine S-methyltransferase
MLKYSFKSKIGNISLFSDNNKIIKIIMQSDKFYNDVPDKAIVLAEKEIIEYLDNKRKDFNFPIYYDGSAFQKQVLKTMKSIPYGEKWSYSLLAEKAGYKNAVRAVGTVCKNNPLPLIIPCHRVIKKNGDIGNFYGGQDLKKYLLNIEKSLQ